MLKTLQTIALQKNQLIKDIRTREIKPKFRGQHILSDFFKTGIINEIWPENKSVKLCEVYSESEYKKKKHLADILGLSIKNQEEIESFLSYVENQKKKHYNQVN